MEKVTFRERIFLDRYKCIDREKTAIIHRSFQSGGLLYGYIDRYNTICISKEDIISIETM